MKAIFLFFLAASLLVTAPSHSHADSVVESIQNRLVAVDGRRVRKHDGAELKQAEYVALYYSASWCPPCKEFTPKLVEFYNEQKKLHAGRFEIVLVSRDRNEKAMEEYMQEATMPWPAVRFRDIDRSGVMEHSGKGIPCLVILDKEGKVVSHSYVDGKFVGPSKVMQDLGKLLKEEG